MNLSKGEKMADRPDIDKYVLDGFLGTNPDLYNLEQRTVTRHKSKELIVSTTWASDWGWYETAISHHDYKKANWIVVEQYGNNRDAAQMGHDRWVERMTTEPLPKALKDVVIEAYGKKTEPFQRNS